MYNPNNYLYQQPIRQCITWVQGIEGAKTFQLPPNSSAVLMDSDSDGIFYIKITDNIGMCTVRTFKYQETFNQPTQTTNYVTRDEVQQMIRELRNEQSIQGVATKPGQQNGSGKQRYNEQQ